MSRWLQLWLHRRFPAFVLHPGPTVEELDEHATRANAILGRDGEVRFFDVEAPDADRP